MNLTKGHTQNQQKRRKRKIIKSGDWFILKRERETKKQYFLTKENSCDIKQGNLSRHKFNRQR